MRGDILMSDLQTYKQKQMEDPAFREQYERTRPEYEILHSIIEARLNQNLTQKELAERSGVRQSNISRIENGTSSPTVATLQALAAGMGKKLRISFE